MLEIRSLESGDRAALVGILESDGTFRSDEIDVALELIDDALANNASDYWVRVALLDGVVSGYICFGPTPMTESTFDLYWIVTHKNARGHGVAPSLVRAMETELAKKRSVSIRVETSQTEGYGAARRLYAKLGYPEAARFKNFYKAGDDLIVYYKRVGADD